MSSVKFGKLDFASPILVASGTYGYGHETKSMVDVNGIGGIITKSVTLHPREGNPPPRIVQPIPTKHAQSTIPFHRVLF